MMQSKLILLLLGSFICLSQSAPLLGLDDEDIYEDTAIVESTVREVRAVKDSDVAPANYHKVYDSGDKGDKGYSRQVSDKGKTGYQTFDSFHKKGGDSYGYEKHDSFGVKGKHGTGGHKSNAGHSSKQGGKNAKYQAADDVESDDDGGSYESSDDSGNDYNESEDSSDDGESAEEGEEAAVAVSGYDEADAANYDNPSGYTYGSGAEYDF